MTAPASIRFLNLLMGALLRSPLHGAASKSVLLISVKGRKTGRTITTPVSYSQEGDRLTIFSQGSWVKNLSGGAPVTVRVRGKDYQGFATSTADNLPAKADGLARHLSIVRGDARYFGVTFDPDGVPDRGQIEKAAQKNIMICVQLS